MNALGSAARVPATFFNSVRNSFDVWSRESSECFDLTRGVGRDTECGNESLRAHPTNVLGSNFSK